MKSVKILMILLLGSVAAFSQPRPRVYNHSRQTTVIVRRPVIVPYHGISYRYSGGYFYRPYGNYWRPGPPPIGIRISTLPYGYMPLYVGPSLFFYNSGIFYRRYDNSNYEVVDPPMGAQVSSLPSGAKTVTVNGEEFYEYNGTYYKETTNDKGKTVYTVTGKNGEINNTPEEPATPQLGDLVDQLPDGCKTISLNGETYYVSPDDVYYKQHRDNNNTSYEVVGKPTTDSINN